MCFQKKTINPYFSNVLILPIEDFISLLLLEYLIFSFTMSQFSNIGKRYLWQSIHYLEEKSVDNSKQWKTWILFFFFTKIDFKSNSKSEKVDSTFVADLITSSHSLWNKLLKSTYLFLARLKKMKNFDWTFFMIAKLNCSCSDTIFYSSNHYSLHSNLLKCFHFLLSDEIISVYILCLHIFLYFLNIEVLVTVIFLFLMYFMFFLSFQLE